MQTSIAIPEKIRQKAIARRRQYALTPTELGEVLHLSRATIYRFEKKGITRCDHSSLRAFRAFADGEYDCRLTLFQAVRISSRLYRTLCAFQSCCRLLANQPCVQRRFLKQMMVRLDNFC